MKNAQILDSTMQWLITYQKIPGAFWLRTKNQENKNKDNLCIPLENKHAVFELTESENYFVSIPKHSTFLLLDNENVKKLQVEVKTQKLTETEAKDLNKTFDVYYIPIQVIS